MADLNAAVSALADALDALDGRIDERLSDLAHQDDAVDAARRHARTARAAAADASDSLSSAIASLRELIGGPRLVEKE